MSDFFTRLGRKTRKKFDANRKRKKKTALSMAKSEAIRQGKAQAKRNRGIRKQNQKMFDEHRKRLKQREKEIEAFKKKRRKEILAQKIKARGFRKGRAKRVTAMARERQGFF